MKFWFLLVGVTVTLLVILFSASLMIVEKPLPPLDIDSWMEFEPETQTDQAKAYLSRRRVHDEGAEYLVAHLFQHEPTAAEDLLSEIDRADLGTLLPDSIFVLLREGETDAASALFQLTVDWFPGDPDFFGIKGVIAYYRGEEQIARQLFQEAISWKRGNPVIYFFYGGLLTTSEDVGDRIRGKELLLLSLDTSDEDLRRRAAMTVLTDPGLPVSEADLRKTFSALPDPGEFFTQSNELVTLERARRVLAQLATLMPQEAHQLAEAITRFPASTAHDRLRYIELAQRTGHLETAQEQLNTLGEVPEEYRDLAEFLSRRQLLLEGDLAEFSRQMHSVRKNRDLSPDELMMVRSCLSGNPARTIAAELSRLLFESSNAPVTVKLEALTYQINHGFEKRAVLVDKAIALYDQSPQGVGTWLLHHEAEKQLIDLANQTVPHPPEFVPILIEALIRQNAFEEARQLVSKRADDLPPDLYTFLKVKIAGTENIELEALAIITEEAEEAAGSGNFLLVKEYGLLAVSLGKTKLGFNLLAKAFPSGVPFTGQEAWIFFNLSLDHGTLAQLLAVAEFLPQVQPGKPDFHNTRNYFRMYLEEERLVREATREAKNLLEAHPESTDYRLTYAFGLLAQGDPRAAREVLDAGDMEIAKIGSRGQLIYAAILHATGEEMVAESIVRNLNEAVFIEEEQAILRSL